MQANLDLIGDRSLKQLTLPASHDAAMYLTGFPQSLGRTQNLSIFDQLNHGVRYFDLRPAFRNGEIVMHHDMILGPRLATVLDDVARYMTGHRELVILKFSHYDQLNETRYAGMATQIATKLHRWLWQVRSGKRLADIPLREFLRTNGSVLVVCEGNDPIHKPVPGIWVYRDWEDRDAAAGDLRVFDQYANSMSYPTMKADQFKKFADFNGRCKHADVPCDLFLLSWTLTPPTGVPGFAKDVNPHLPVDLKTLTIPNTSGQIPNLLYVDCVELGGVTDAAIELNLNRR
jgi:hypothetical protein